MAKSNMKDGKPMRRNNRFPGLSGIAMVLFLFLLFPCLYAQDAIPALSRPLEPLRIPGETKEMHRGMRLITVHDSLPASFTHSLDNVIEDENRSLSPFFQKLNDMTGILFETLMYGKEQYERRKAYEEE